MERISEGPISANVSQYLENLNFPASKHEVVHAARRNRAPDPVVAQLEAISQTSFASLDDLRRAYAEAPGS